MKQLTKTQLQQFVPAKYYSDHMHQSSGSLCSLENKEKDSTETPNLL